MIFDLRRAISCLQAERRALLGKVGRVCFSVKPSNARRSNLRQSSIINHQS